MRWKGDGGQEREESGGERTLKGALHCRLHCAASTRAAHAEEREDFKA